MTDLELKPEDAALLAYCNKVREQADIKPLSFHELLEYTNANDWKKYQERVRAIINELNKE